MTHSSAIKLAAHLNKTPSSGISYEVRETAPAAEGITPFYVRRHSARLTKDQKKEVAPEGQMSLS